MKKFGGITQISKITPETDKLIEQLKFEIITKAKVDDGDILMFTPIRQCTQVVNGLNYFVEVEVIRDNKENILQYLWNLVSGVLGYDDDVDDYTLDYWHVVVYKRPDGRGRLIEVRTNNRKDDPFCYL